MDWLDWIAAFLGVWALLLLIELSQDAHDDVRDCKRTGERVGELDHLGSEK